jgi:hypothetical protein
MEKTLSGLIERGFLTAEEASQYRTGVMED